VSRRRGPDAGAPVAADEAAAARLAKLADEVGDELVGSVRRMTAATNDIAFLAAADVAALITTFGLRSAREAAILAIPAAATLARPPISDYHVGAVGLATTGELVLGGNLEFPGASIHHTVHGEGFVTLRARALGRPLAELAISQARPCAHCRQVLAEMAWAADLRVVDPLGHDLALWDLYPWPFTPADLGGTGANPTVRAVPGPGVEASLPVDVRAGLLRAGASAHAPYSREPAAIALRLADGRLISGAVLESVAFNPTIGPLQDALVALAAGGIAFAAVREAWLGVTRQGRVDHVGPTRDLLAAVAPAASLHVTYWT
jgi:cytidine deaminase